MKRHPASQRPVRSRTRRRHHQPHLSGKLFNIWVAAMARKPAPRLVMETAK